MEPLWPIWQTTLSLDLEAISEDVAKQMIQNIENQLESLHGVHVLGATVLKKEEPSA